ncbi:MAG TPA: hypothetical protein VKU60_13800 [Chloroflexota bacterium]|nr:hypothetical protein [Chloroflexota bacterium]
MSPLPPEAAKRRAGPVKTISAAITSCAGVGGAASISATHGSNRIALLIFVTTQAWPLCELVARWWIKWRYERLWETLVHNASDHPDDVNRRTLLIDMASTHLDDLGERIPIRDDLK